MKKTATLIFIAFLIFFSAFSVFAQEDLDLKEKIDLASKDVSDFFGATPSENIVVVSGSKISVEDKLLFNLIKSNLDLPGLTILTDHSDCDSNKNLVLLGSEKTNTFAQSLKEDNLFENRVKKDYSPLILETANIGERKVLLIYSKKEVENVQSTVASKSLLNNIMDEKYVPAAATFLSILLMYLWQVFSKTLFDFLNEAASSKILDKKASNHKIKKGEFLNKNEIIAFFVFVLAFAFSLSYGYSTGIKEFFHIFLINFIIIGIISLIRELARLRFCFKNKLRSEFVLWPFGTVVTFISTFLGNTFSLASYTLLDEDESGEKKFGKSAFLISLFTFILAIAAYLFNIFFPNLILQMIFVFSIMIVFIEMFPMNPMPGNDMKDWNFPVWLISYIIVIITYILLNFSIYV